MDPLFYLDHLLGLLGLAAVPSPVEVQPVQVCSIVAHHYSVWVDHGKHYNFIVFSQIDSLLLLR